MTTTKYSNLITKEPIKDGRFAPGISFISEDEGNLKLNVHYIEKPFIMVEQAHKHDDIQFLCFYGGNPKNISDFNAQVKIYLGDEMETHLIDTAAMVYIPKGLVHCPLEFTKVDEPIVMIGIYLSSQYART